MRMAEISVDLIQMVYYHAHSCAISPLAFLLYVQIQGEGVIGWFTNNVICQFLAQLISCAITNQPLGCGCWHCCWHCHWHCWHCRQDTM